MVQVAHEPDWLARLAVEWNSLVESIPARIVEQMGRLCDEHTADLAACFYETLLTHSEARRYLSHEIVTARLREALQEWVRSVLDQRQGARGAEMVALQRHVGAMHARISVGHHLVLRGAGILKRRAAFHFAGTERGSADALEAALTASTLIDFAMEVMTVEYVASDRASRADEAYRVFSLTANMSLERERQRGALLDWKAKTLQSTLWAQPGDRLQPIGGCSFGLWIQHKAAAIFRAAPAWR